MPKDTVSYSELTHQVVQQAPEPLPFDEIMARVAAIAPITTKNPKQTIRNAIGASRIIVAVGGKRYGWKPRVINGSVLRLTLTADELAAKRLLYTDEVRDALYPTFFESGKRSDRGPVTLVLSEGDETNLTLEQLGTPQWGTPGLPALWNWLAARRARAGDDLIITVLDGEARRYGATFESRAARDEAAIVARNREIIVALLPFVKRPHGTMIWDITHQLLCTGHYRHPVAPDPLIEIVASEDWQVTMAELGLINGWNPFDRGIFSGLLGSFNGILRDLEDVDEIDQDDNSFDPPAEHQPIRLRRPGPSVQGTNGPITTYVLRVTHRAFPKTWRDIEISANQTLEDLHLAIQDAYRWDNDHLYSFFLNGRAWDARSEIGSPWSDSPRHTDEMTLDSLGLKLKRKILYLFDYGDGHEFDVEVLAINENARKGTYPKVVGKQGRAPRQYWSG